MNHRSRALNTFVPLAAIAALVAATAVPAPAQRPVHGASNATMWAHDGRGPTAAMAREVNLQETGRLHAVGEPGTTILEHGSATGTFNSSIAVHLTIVSANRVTATFTVRPRGGSITGGGSARFAQKGANGYFGGTISIKGGTGSYAHAAGTNIGISGVISRETFALTVHVHGKIRV